MNKQIEMMMKIYQSTQKERNIALLAREIVEENERLRADTVRKMQARLKEEKTIAFGSQCEVVPLYVVDQIAKEMLDGMVDMANCTQAQRTAYYKSKLNEIFGTGCYQDTDTVLGENDGDK